MTDSTDIVLTDKESTAVTKAGLAAASVVAAAHDLSVETPEQAERASNILRDLQTVRKRAEDERKALTKPYREHEKQINDNYRAPAAMLDEADQTIRVKVGAYLAEQERIRAERQAAIDAEAEEQRHRDEAERERQVAAARAQRERWEEEHAAREAHAAGHATAEAMADAEAAGKAAKAMAELERARQLAALPVRRVPTVEPVKPSAGIAVKRSWTFEVVNPKQVPDQLGTHVFRVVDETEIRKFMRAQVKAGYEPSLPGVRFYQNEGLSVRGR